ncbi:MAG: cation:proton antiporter [Candidatus Borkfalkiaceae bacterium]|nr:cation:proton antiporter [Christensenellaceae bacterium]
MNTLLCLAIAMSIGLGLTRLAKLIGLPNVTAYLLAGLAMRYLMQALNCIYFEGLDIISNVALGFIAFSIGSSFKLKHLKEIGKSVVVITCFQALITVVFVDIVLAGLHFANLVDLPTVLCLGAIATATAPAATLMVVRQYRARGIVTDTLLPVVAFDDAIGLVVFAVSLAIAKVLAVEGGSINVMDVLVMPLLEIIASLAIGSVIGVALSYLAKVFKSRANRISLCIVAVFAGVGLSGVFGNGFELSDLLTCMSIGVFYVNLNKESGSVMDIMDRWTAPLFMLFFIISGSELDPLIIPSVGILGIAYIISRSAGKYFGARLGARVVNADHNVRKYLGLTLLPQAGVAIGMAQKIKNTPALSGIADGIVTVTLCATLVYELVGPLITKWALEKAGEIKIERKNKNDKTDAGVPPEAKTPVAG